MFVLGAELNGFNRPFILIDNDDPIAQVVVEQAF